MFWTTHVQETENPATDEDSDHTGSEGSVDSKNTCEWTTYVICEEGASPFCFNSFTWLGRKSLGPTEIDQSVHLK